jgi:N-acetylneuraminic acid mutarotase
VPDAVILAGGSDLQGTQRQFLRDAYRLAQNGWTRLPDLPLPVQAGFAWSHAGVPMILSGSDGTLAAFEAELGADHPGFSPLIWKLDGTRWIPVGRLPYAPVTTTLVEWNGAIVIPGGEDRPAHRSSRVILGKFVDE